MTSQTITINSDYFQVTPEGQVTCQKLAVTGAESFINLNDTFVVNNLGNVCIYDEGWQGQERNAQLLIVNQDNNGEYTGIYSNYFEIIEQPRSTETWGRSRCS